MLRKCFFVLQRYKTRQIIFDNTRLETSVCRVKATLEIKKRHGNSREIMQQKKKRFWIVAKYRFVSGKF